MNHIEIIIHVDTMMSIDDMKKKVEKNFDNSKIDIVHYSLESFNEFPSFI
jgi:hypothetical protein